MTRRTYNGTNLRETEGRRTEEEEAEEPPALLITARNIIARLAPYLCIVFFTKSNQITPNPFCRFFFQTNKKKQFAQIRDLFVHANLINKKMNR